MTDILDLIDMHRQQIAHYDNMRLVLRRIGRLTVDIDLKLIAKMNWHSVQEDLLVNQVEQFEKYFLVKDHIDEVVGSI